jgi:hypothetical protein
MIGQLRSISIDPDIGGTVRHDGLWSRPTNQQAYPASIMRVSQGSAWPLRFLAIERARERSLAAAHPFFSLFYLFLLNKY